MSLFKGIQGTRNRMVSHNFFVDDILIFGALILSQWQVMHNILECFGRVTRMVANEDKSIKCDGDLNTIRLVYETYISLDMELSWRDLHISIST